MTMLMNPRVGAGFGVPYNPIPWPRFKEEILALYRPPLRAKTTFSGMQYAFRTLEPLGLETTADLTLALIGRWVESRPKTLSPNSVRGGLRYLQAICSLAQELGYVNVSPFALRRVGKWVRPVPPSGLQFCTREEIRRVGDHMAAQCTGGGWFEFKARRVLTLFWTLALTGCRYSEALFLQVKDVDLANGTISIVSRAEHRLKTAGAHDTLPLLDELKAHITAWLPYRMSVPPDFVVDDPECPWLFPTLHRHKRAPWTSGGPGQRPNVRVKTLAAEVGVLCTPLMLRHSWGSWLAASGAGEKVIQQWLRHSNTGTQRFYVHRSLDALRAAGSKVSY
jgi:integrase